MSSTTITDLIASQVTTIGTFMPTVLTAVIGVAVLLIGAGWAWSRFKRHVHGKKI